MIIFLLVAIAPMAVNIWFFRQETKQRKKEIERKNPE